MNDFERRMAEFKRRQAQQQAKMRHDADRQRQQSERLRKENERKSREQRQQSEKLRRESERRQEKAKAEAQRRQDRAEADTNRREDRKRQERWRKEDRADKERLEQEHRFEGTSSYREPTISAGNGPYSDYHTSGSGCLKRLVVLIALMSLLWWQRDTVVPAASLAWVRLQRIAHDVKSSPAQDGIQNDILSSHHQDERSESKSTVFRAQNHPSKLSSKPEHAGTVTPTDLSFADMIQDAAIEHAVYGSLASGKPKRWRQDKRNGYAVASVIVGRDGHDCRSIYVSERDGAKDLLTNAVMYCRSGDEWYAN